MSRILQGNKNNIYTAALNVAAKTITFGSINEYDLSVQSIAKVYDVTAGVIIPSVIGMTCVNVVVAGLPTWVITYPTLPGGLSNGDTLIILLNIPGYIYWYSALQQWASGSTPVGGNFLADNDNDIFSDNDGNLILSQ